MPQFNLFGEVVAVATRDAQRKRAAKKEIVRGCAACPLNTVRGLRKVRGLTRLQQRRAMLWAQSPGERENQTGLELVGAAGTFLWEEMKYFGLARSDFDVQNVLRCRPLDVNATGSQEHTPTKRELHCCSIFNERALAANAGAAQVHLILGKIAGVQLLGRAYRKNRPVQWYEPWNAYVVLADHPSYLLRQGGRKAGWPYYTFLDRLKALRFILRYPGRWGYVRAQDYGKVITLAEVRELKDRLYAEARAGRRVGVDIEDGTVDGQSHTILLIGFSLGKPRKRFADWHGWARSVVVDHPGVKRNPRERAAILAELKLILEDPKLEKALQHGSYDCERLREKLGIRVRGYTYDTQYGTYLRHSHLRTYSLESQAAQFFPEFADYKLMVAGYENYADVPLDTLVTYNCADADLTKRLESRTTGHVSLPLLQVYIDAAFVFAGMSERGPYLDQEAYTYLSKHIPRHIERLHRELCQAARREDFNPNKPQHIAWLLFDKLKLPQLERRSTAKEILQTLVLQTRSPIPQLVLDYRKLAKVESTYLLGYKRSADMHAGQLRTIWWLTGAATGRLRSGKGDIGDIQGIVNMQNFHGNPALLNLLVSDTNWREAL